MVHHSNFLGLRDDMFFFILCLPLVVTSINSKILSNNDNILKSLDLSEHTQESLITPKQNYKNGIFNNRVFKEVYTINGKRIKTHKDFVFGKLLVTNSIFSHCRMRDADGGAICSLCDTVIENSCFKTCSSCNGGALFIIAECNISSCSFSSCTASTGGAIFINSSFITLNNSFIKSCYSSGIAGAGQVVAMEKFKSFHTNYSCNIVVDYISAVSLSATAGFIFNTRVTANKVREMSACFKIYEYAEFIIEQASFIENEAMSLTSGIHFKGKTFSQAKIAKSVFISPTYRSLPSIYRESGTIEIVDCEFNRQRSIELDLKIIIDNLTRFNTAKFIHNTKKIDMFCMNFAYQPQQTFVERQILLISSFHWMLLFIAFTLIIFIKRICECHRMEVKKINYFRSNRQL